MEQLHSSSERSNLVSRLLTNRRSRAAYIRSKLSVLVPAQIRALRLRSVNPPMPRQKDLARESEMHQSRISMFETPGAANLTLGTLAEIGAALKSGVVVKFVPYSEMLEWENDFNPDTFDVTRIDGDQEFIAPEMNVEESSIASQSKSESLAMAISSGLKQPYQAPDTEQYRAFRPSAQMQQLQGVIGL